MDPRNVQYVICMIVRCCAICNFLGLHIFQFSDISDIFGVASEESVVVRRYYTAGGFQATVIFSERAKRFSLVPCFSHDALQQRRGPAGVGFALHRSVAWCSPNVGWRKQSQIDIQYVAKGVDLF